MERSTNALAELAERLKQAEVNIGQGYYTDDIRKAQRIIAELAKHANISLIHADCYGCALIKTIVDCREIAEKGAGDGK